jgi:methyl acetate hydrolase
MTMPISRRSVLETGAILASTALVTRQVLGQNLAASSSKDNLDAVLRGIVERGDVPGVVAAVTDPAETVYLAAFGERGLGQGVAMTPDTVFYLASMTKPVTATAAMQLVEQGELELDVPISRWAPRAADLQVLDGWDASGKPILRAPKREVTLRDLLTHTSGLPTPCGTRTSPDTRQKRRFPSSPRARRPHSIRRSSSIRASRSAPTCRRTSSARSA